MEVPPWLLFLSRQDFILHLFSCSFSTQKSHGVHSLQHGLLGYNINLGTLFELLKEVMNSERPKLQSKMT